MTYKPLSATDDKNLAYLIGGDGSIAEVTWKGSDKYILDPVSWK